MNLVLVEDDVEQLNTYQQTFSGFEDIQVVGAYASAEAAMPILDELSVDILLTDIHMEGMSGIGLIAKVKAMGRRIEVIALTSDQQVETVIQAFKAGATGYILKTERLEDMVKTLREIISGGFPMSPDIARGIIQEYQSGASGTEAELLSQRQMEILRDVESGYPYKVIAHRLSISIHTVHNHIRNIFDKLHVSNKQEAIQEARKQGLI